MDFQHALDIFTVLYENINGYRLSSEGKTKTMAADKAFTYGEVSPEAFYKMLKDISFPKDGVFYDLGSGTGKAVVLAHLLFPFSKSIGIELLEPLDHTAREIVFRYKEEFEQLLPASKKHQKIILKRGSFLDENFADADVIFTHSTCFPLYIWEELSKRWHQLKKGSYVLTVTATIDSPYLKHLKSKEFNMAWGRATVHFYQRI